MANKTLVINGTMGVTLVDCATDEEVFARVKDAMINQGGLLEIKSRDGGPSMYALLGGPAHLEVVDEAAWAAHVQRQRDAAAAAAQAANGGTHPLLDLSTPQPSPRPNGPRRVK